MTPIPLDTNTARVINVATASCALYISNVEIVSCALYISGIEVFMYVG